MAPLAQNLTARYWLDYTTGRIEHTLMVRYNGVTPAFAGVQESVLALLEELQAVLPTAWKPLRARYADQGSNISLPVEMPAALASFTGTNGTGNPEVNEPREVRWIGRSPTTGRRVALSLYGAVFNTPSNYRFGPGEAVFTSPDVLTLLNGEGSSFRAIDGSVANWYSYANVNFNSYWESASRRS